MKPYDWALDDRALFYNPPRQKYLCLQEHICYESKKSFMKGYVYCSQCDQELPFLTVRGIMARGIYTPIYMCEIIEKG